MMVLLDFFFLCETVNTSVCTLAVTIANVGQARKNLFMLGAAHSFNIKIIKCALELVLQAIISTRPINISIIYI